MPNASTGPEVSQLPSPYSKREGAPIRHRRKLVRVPYRPIKPTMAMATKKSRRA